MYYVHRTSLPLIYEAFSVLAAKLNGCVCKSSKNNAGRGGHYNAVGYRDRASKHDNYIASVNTFTGAFQSFPFLLDFVKPTPQVQPLHTVA